jgi:hypothetical protein
VPDVSFRCDGVRGDHRSAAPTLLFDLHLEEATGVRIHAVVLRCQLRIEPIRRRYTGAEERRLVDLFGEPERWGDTLKPIQFAYAVTIVPAFVGSVDTVLAVPVSYDTEVAAGKYFRGLEGGEIPLLLLFSGTVFYAGPDGLLVDQIPWDREVNHRLPVATWTALMDAHFPGTGWIRLSRGTLDALSGYRSRQMLPSWEDAFAALLKQAGEPAP